MVASIPEISSIHFAVLNCSWAWWTDIQNRIKSQSYESDSDLSSIREYVQQNEKNE